MKSWCKSIPSLSTQSILFMSPIRLARQAESSAAILPVPSYPSAKLSQPAVAMYAAQLVRHSAEITGATITLFGTASESRFQMLRNQPYYYDHLVDYHDTSWPDKIRELSGGVGMDYILDCISEGDSVTKV